MDVCIVTAFCEMYGVNIANILCENYDIHVTDNF